MKYIIAAAIMAASSAIATEPIYYYHAPNGGAYRVDSNTKAILEQNTVSFWDGYIARAKARNAQIRTNTEIIRLRTESIRNR